MFKSLKIRTVARARRIYASRTGKRLLWLLLATPPGRRIAFWLVAQMRSPETRRLFVEAIQGVNATGVGREKFAALAKKKHARKPDDPVLFDILIVALLHAGDPEQTLAAVYSDMAEYFQREYPEDTSILGVRITLNHELEDFAGSLAAARDATNIDPGVLRLRPDYLRSAFAAGRMLQQRDAIEFFGRQYRIVPDHKGRATDRELDHVIDKIFQSTIYTLGDTYSYLTYKLGREPEVGVFFLSSTEALGHAILDPYHFIALNRTRFDHFVFIGPPRSSYRPASRMCLQIVEQYGDYIETASDLLLNLSWMCLGHHRVGHYTLMVDNYWSLLRLAVHRTRDDSDSFRHNAWHFRLPEYFETIGEAFCEQHGISLERPLVVMHARDEGYHRIARQSFRDTNVKNYDAAIQYLLGGGYQVLRLGDRKMPPLGLEHPDYHELPFLDGYQHEVDPYLISRAKFMIGCQSGPCAFARALGVPVLTVNGVLHYTLLPSIREMVCFKRYYVSAGGRKTGLPLTEALNRGLAQLDNAYQYARENIVVENATPDEILASVRDMEAWVHNPGLPETVDQVQFRQQVERYAQRLRAGRDHLRVPMADYIGICLDGYRISPTVESMRLGATKAA